MWITDWTARARCKGTDPEELFVQGAAQNRAKQICRPCPVRTECLADALDNRIEFGVWGGQTERERRALLRRRPDVTSWRDLLECAQHEYETTGDLTLPASSPMPPNKEPAALLLELLGNMADEDGLVPDVSIKAIRSAASQLSYRGLGEGAIASARKHLAQTGALTIREVRRPGRGGRGPVQGQLRKTAAA